MRSDCPSKNIPDEPNFPYFFFNDTATTEIYTLSLHDALPIYEISETLDVAIPHAARDAHASGLTDPVVLLSPARSEEHTSELQSPCNLVCRLLLEKKKNASEGYAR